MLATGVFMKIICIFTTRGRCEMKSRLHNYIFSYTCCCYYSTSIQQSTTRTSFSPSNFTCGFHFEQSHHLHLEKSAIIFLLLSQSLFMIFGFFTNFSRIQRKKKSSDRNFCSTSSLRISFSTNMSSFLNEISLSYSFLLALFRIFFYVII